MSLAVSNVPKFAAVMLAFGSASGPVLADDLIPPPWTRFASGTTVQAWDFHGGPAGGVPDGGLLFNPYGTPTFIPANPSNWLTSFFGRNDVWAVNDFDPLHFIIPNDGPEPLSTKDIWLQVTYQSVSPLTFGISFSSQFGNATLVGSPIVTPLADGWTHEASKWRIAGCPESETLTITPPIPGTTIFIDQVVIDTACYVPGPGAWSVLAIGVLAGQRRRRDGRV